MARESKLEARLRSEVIKHGGMCEKLMPTTKGIPDRILILPGGRIYLVEMKAENGKLSPAQLSWHAKSESRGVRVITIKGRKELDAWLEAVLY